MEESRRLNTSEVRLALFYECLSALLPCLETGMQTLPPSWGPGGHLGHALLLLPKSYLTYPPCCRHHVYFSIIWAFENFHWPYHPSPRNVPSV